MYHVYTFWSPDTGKTHISVTDTWPTNKVVIASFVTITALTASFSHLPGLARTLNTGEGIPLYGE